MLFGALVIDLLFIGLGALMRYTAFDPNPTFGYRTTRSMQSREAWAYANRKGGTMMAVIGLACLATAIALAAFDGATGLTATDAGSAAAACLYMGLPLIGIIAIVPVVECDLKKRFDSKGREGQNASVQAEATEPTDFDQTASMSNCKQGDTAPLRKQAPLSPVERIALGVLCLAPLIIALCGFTALPDTIAVHFAAGGPDGWAPKSQIFLFAAIMAASNLLLTFAYRIARNQQKTASIENAARSMRTILFAVFAFCMLSSSGAVAYVVLVNAS